MQILCATDFSKVAMAAADIAAGLAKKLKIPLRLVHCGQDYVVMGDLPVVIPNDQPLREQLKCEAVRLRTTGLEVIEELRHGGASLEIIDAAVEQPTSLIVMGSVGKGLADRWLIGSVAERVAEGSVVPTLLIRQPELLLDWLSGAAALHLLCGVDFTASADAAIAAMQTFVDLGGVEVEAAYLAPSEYPVITQDQRAFRQRDVWERLHAILGDVPVKVHVREVASQPAVEFLRAADERQSGLLVVGAHQRHGWQRLKAPSFSRNVVAHASTNVLCVPTAAGLSETRIPSIHRVLVATNFTKVCTDALRHAHSLLPAGGALHLVHVCPEPTSGINPVIASELYFDHSIATGKAKEEAEKKLNELPAHLRQVAGVTVTSEVLVYHDISAAICEAADRFGADVICMGTTGHSRAGAALLGSTVEAVLARTHKPVFIATTPLD